MALRLYPAQRPSRLGVTVLSGSSDSDMERDSTANDLRIATLSLFLRELTLRLKRRDGLPISGQTPHFD
jgi:hypothetical protein